MKEELIAILRELHSRIKGSEFRSSKWVTFVFWWDPHASLWFSICVHFEPLIARIGVGPFWDATPPLITIDLSADPSLFRKQIASTLHDFKSQYAEKLEDWRESDGS